jgi:hypothetical protein
MLICARFVTINKYWDSVARIDGSPSTSGLRFKIKVKV